MNENEAVVMLSRKDRFKMFWVLLANETRKLFTKKKYIVFFIIGVMICIGNFGIKMLINFMASSDMFGSMSSFKLNLSTSLNMLGFLAEIYIPFIVFTATNELFGTEYQNGSIRALLVRPVTRLKIYFSKILAVFVVCAALFLGLFGVSAVLDVISGDMNGVEFLSVSSVYLIDLFPIFVIILMAALINGVLRNSGLSMLVCIVIYAVLKIGGIFIPTVSGLLFTGYTKWHTLWMGAALPFGVMLNKLMLLLGYTVVLGSSGYYIFLKSDF